MKNKVIILLAITLFLALCSCASRRCDCSDWSYQFAIEESNEA